MHFLSSLLVTQSQASPSMPFPLFRFRSRSLQLLSLPVTRPLVTSSSSRSLLNKPSNPPPKPTTAIFWDLDNKPPSSIPPYDAAVRLKLVASQFGIVKYTVAYANHHAFRHVPAPIRDQRRERKALDRLENAGDLVPNEPYLCRVCGRRFYNHTRLVNHFKQIHEREQTKRLNKLESSKGSRRVKLAAKLSMKMEKYKRAVTEVLVPKVGYGLADELLRARVWVRKVPDKPEAADRALREHMVEAMDGGIKCLVLVSDDSGFAGVLREARMRCLKTVVVGDDRDGGALKRLADAGFSWSDVASGKAKKEVVSVVGRWKDRDLLKRLEWTYNRPEEEGEIMSESNSGDDCFGGESDDESSDDGIAILTEMKNSALWWKKLEPNSPDALA